MNNAGLFQKLGPQKITFASGITFNNAGTVEVDSGTLAFSSLTYSSNSKTIITITSPTSSGHITTANAFTLVGPLTLNLAPTYTPTPGDSFTVLTSSSLSGQFSRVSANTALPANLGIAVTYTPTSAIATIALLGDTNLDNRVDLNDLNTILNNLGTTTSDWTRGNFDGAPTIDLNDLNDVLNHLGTGYAPAPSIQYADSLLAASSVPEPSTLVAMLPALVVYCRRSSRR